MIKKLLTSRFRSGKGDITPIINLELAYKVARDRTISVSDLCKLCEIALYGDAADKTVDVRNKQTFLLGIRTNLKAYNPTAPEAVLQALADISAYLYNDKDTDPLIKAALVHYQFEMIHPFERYNGIVGRIVIPMISRDIIREALPLMCLSEYLYHNKNKYFDLLRTTQYSGGYIRWIKFFVSAIGETAKQSARLLEQYEHIIAENEKYLIYMIMSHKSIVTVYGYLKRFPITNISYAVNQTGLSFNSISKALTFLQENGVVSQRGSAGRNRFWEYDALLQIVDAK